MNPAATPTSLGRTAVTGTLIDLLQAAAHDPALEDNSDSDEDSDPTPSTPTDSSHDDILAAQPSHHFSPEKEAAIPFPERTRPVRGGSVVLEERKSAILTRNLANQLALDRMDDADASIKRAQEDASTDDEVEDKSTEGTDQPAARLATLVHEFGAWTGEGKEEWLIQIPGALFRGVLIKGLLALTTKRFFIFAFVPPREANKVIRSGPVTVHMSGRFVKPRRVWVELRSDSCTWYRNSASLYEPLGSCRLSNVREVLPLGPAQPHSYTIILNDGRTRTFEFSTAESTIAWHSDLVATLFSFRNTADRLRVSLPLELITKVTTAPYMNLATSVSVEFGNEHSEEDSPDQSKLLEFGFLRTHETFAGMLLSAIDRAHEKPSGVKVPPPILEIDSPLPADEVARTEELANDNTLAANFVRKFALSDHPNELFVSPHVELVRTLPTWGSLAIGSTYLCFSQKNLVTSDVNLRVPLVDLDGAAPCKAFGFSVYGLAVQVHGAPDLRFDFKKRDERDRVVQKINDVVLNLKLAAVAVEAQTAAEPATCAPVGSLGVAQTASPGVVTPGRGDSIDSSRSSQVSGDTAKSATVCSSFGPTQATVLGENLVECVQIDVTQPVLPLPRVIGAVGHKRVSGLHVVCLTIGSRGDVQPYISLGIQLMKDGNTCTIASHPEYRDWVESFGIGFRPVGGDPTALMQLATEHPVLSPSFFKESLGHFRKWLDDLYMESWEAVQGADIVIESPSTMTGLHVAEALGVPYFRAFTMPWTRTAQYPHAFASSVELGPLYNLSSYALFDKAIWTATAGQVNKFRKEVLGLKPTSLHKMSTLKTPFIYNFSPALVPKPLDWHDNIFLSGYWFLDSNKDYEPPAGLREFIEQARRDGKKVAYVGFGSIVVPDAPAVTRAVVAATLAADVRVVLSKGWSDRGASKKDDTVIPSEIFVVPSVDHTWLFPLIDMTLTHGGAGTTGASLRFGLVTAIAPFFGDQFFWASRVRHAGCGLQIHGLTEKEFEGALRKGSSDRIMIERAQAMGEQIRKENGVRAALDFVYSHIHLAQERTDIRRARAEGDAHAGHGRPRVHVHKSADSASSANDGAALTRNRSFASRTLSGLHDALVPSPRSSSPAGRAKGVVSGLGAGAGAVGAVVASTLKRAAALPLPRKVSGQEVPVESKGEAAGERKEAEVMQQDG